MSIHPLKTIDIGRWNYALSIENLHNEVFIFLYIKSFTIKI